jgi:phosphoglycerate dehydrogenase-like enzyme
MLPGKDELNICFAHAAYRMAERFAARGTGIAHFQVDTPEEFAARLGEADVVVVSMMWRNELLAAANKLKFIQSISAGMERYDADLIRARGIRLASAAGVNAHAVAEHAMALLLALKRHIHTGRDNQTAKRWRGMISEIGAREDELGGKTMLIVGLGRIGGRLARLAKAFDMKVLATRRKPTAHLVNVARGRVVDEAALIRALQEKRIAAAALDVTREEPLSPDSVLWTMRNVLITPHTAGETQRYEDGVVDLLLANLRRLWRGEPTLVNEVV